MFSVSRKTVVVMGAARSGIAAAELLADRGAHVTLSEAEDRLSPRDDRDPRVLAESLVRRGVRVELGGHVPETLAQADLVVLSPGVPRSHPVLQPARRRGVPIIGEIELAYRWLRGRVVAITGTKGKSTTTTLTGRMLSAGGVRAIVGGNVGVPLSSQVEASTPETLHVVEVSSFQLETIDRFHPWIAVLLNFSPDHLDRHASLEEYAAAKARLFMNQHAEDWAVINADDPRTLEIARAARARRFAFAMSGRHADGVVLTERAIVHQTPSGAESLVPLSSIRLTGRHLVADVMAAAAVARIVGVTPRAMTEAVETFSGLEHAMEAAGEIAGVRFVNDSKATAITAARQAIENLDGPLVVILGGRFKGGRWEDLTAPLRDKARAIVAIGESRPQIRAVLGTVTTLVEAETMGEAVRQAFRAAERGDTVILAPACASFDMFTDYAERGRAFKQEVVALRREVET
ncbi:MAG: UDP-N-acetylmuramoyl-L-alanine--D-glutamate ligase [Acidobacteria bacterium]|nr:UDP-N-acetylmuramoyl-L-alanine--D-glutamate ligase [Acidobacteriota bacterium]